MQELPDQLEESLDSAKTLLTEDLKETHQMGAGGISKYLGHPSLSLAHEQRAGPEGEQLGPETGPGWSLMGALDCIPGTGVHRSLLNRMGELSTWV